MRCSVALLALGLAAGCAAPPLIPAGHTAPPSNAVESAGRTIGSAVLRAAAAADPVAVDRRRQLAHRAARRAYDAEALEQLCADTATRFAATPPRRDEVQRLARSSWVLADIWKFRATTAGSRTTRRSADRARQAVVRRALPWVEAGLRRAPRNGQLRFLKGELMAFMIDGIASGWRLGPPAERETRHAVSLGAGPLAELALAKRYLYLPPLAGGDRARAAREIRALLARHADCEPAWGMLALVEHARGRRADVVAAARRAVALNPASLRGRRLLDEPTLRVRP